MTIRRLSLLVAAAACQAPGPSLVSPSVPPTSPAPPRAIPDASADAWADALPDAPTDAAIPTAAAPPAGTEHCGPASRVPAKPRPLTPKPSRCRGLVARLADGRVLAVGDGCAELFDNGRWRAAQKPPRSPDEATLTALAEGTALLAGGRNGDAVADASVFDAKRDSWRAVAPLKARRFAHAAVRLRDGRVLVSGGCEYVEACCAEGMCLDSYELYDPRADRWELHSMPQRSARAGHALVELSDGRVLALGGILGDSPALPPSQVWDGTHWCAAPPLLAYRSLTAATPDPDGFAAVVSGPPEPPGPAIELYRYEKECQPACPR